MLKLYQLQDSTLLFDNMTSIYKIETEASLGVTSGLWLSTV